MSQSSAEAPKANPWLLLAIIMPIYFLTMFYRLAPSILAPALSQDFGVSVADLALLSGVTFTAYGLMQLPSGLLADAIGCRKTVCGITLICSIGNIWFALSGSYMSAVASRVLIGIGCSVAVPGLAMLAVNFPKERFAKISALYLTVGTLATVFAGTPLVWAGEHFGWRSVMMAGGVIGLALVVVLWIVGREPATQQKKRLDIAEMLRGILVGFVNVLKNRTFWPLCAWYCLVVGLYTSVVALWWAPFLINGCGLSKETAGQIMSAAYLITIIGQPLMAFLTDFFKTRKWILVGSSVVTLAACLVLQFWGAQMPFAALVAQGTIFNICCGMVSVVAMTSAREMFPATMAGTAVGCLATLPNLVMAPIIQKGFGMAVESSLASNGGVAAAAYSDAYYFNIAIVVLAIIVGLFIKETYGKNLASDK